MVKRREKCSLGMPACALNRFPGMEGPEGPLAAGLPKVHLIDVRQAPQVAEPVVAGDGDSQAHSAWLVGRPILAHA
jgi:hypothetical protein